MRQNCKRTERVWKWIGRNLRENWKRVTTNWGRMRERLERIFKNNGREWERIERESEVDERYRERVRENGARMKEKSILGYFNIFGYWDDVSRADVQWHMANGGLGTFFSKTWARSKASRRNTPATIPQLQSPVWAPRGFSRPAGTIYSAPRGRPPCGFRWYWDISAIIGYAGVSWDTLGYVGIYWDIFGYWDIFRYWGILRYWDIFGYSWIFGYIGSLG